MDSGRIILKYFTASDLEPIAITDAHSAEIVPNLLSPAELEDIRAFSVEFGAAGESMLSRPTSSRKPHLRAFIMFLRCLGAVRFEEANFGVRIVETGRLSRQLPEILSIFLSQSLTLVEDWNTRHVIPEDSLSAVEIIRQLELRRIELSRRAGHRPQALADRPVAFAIFHALNQHGKDCYLFELNKDWRRLNFIGGKQETDDNGDFTETVLREIGEELGIARDRLTVTRLNQRPIMAFSLSGNVGTLASYPCILFGVRVDGEFNTRIQDCWLTEETTRESLSMRDSPLMVNPAYLRYLLEGTPSRMSQTPLSTNLRVRSVGIEELAPTNERAAGRWVRVLKENKDLLAAVITLSAAVLTLAIAFLAA